MLTADGLPLATSPGKLRMVMHAMALDAFERRQPCLLALTLAFMLLSKGGEEASRVQVGNGGV